MSVESMLSVQGASEGMRPVDAAVPDSTPAFALLVDAFCAEQKALRGRLAAIGDGEPQAG